MISAKNIYIKYGDRVLLNHLNFTIKNNDKVGLVGRNGAGKSTILKVLAGQISPDEGSLEFPSDASTGLLKQEIEQSNDLNVFDEALRAFEAMESIKKEIASINEQIINREDYESEAYQVLLTNFSDLNDRFQLLGGEDYKSHTEKILKGLGFKEEDFVKPLSALSGGWRMRVELAKILLQKPDYLFLDEPTNHLDIESIIWFEEFLKNYHGAFVLISHDKKFLDNTTNRTIEIELGNLYDYKMPYSKYLEERIIRKEQQMSAFKNQQRDIEHKEKIIKKFMAKANKTKMAQSMQKQLNKIDRVAVDVSDTHVMKLRFPSAERCGEIVFKGKKLNKTYGENKVLHDVDVQIERGERVAFIGQNGQGKTTLAKIIVEALEPTSGDLNLGHNVTVGYYAQDQSDTLDAKKTVLEVMEDHSPENMRTKLRSILGSFMFSNEDVEKKVSVLSGGERARLAMACMLLRSFNLLVLDEPTNHLDILSKDVLKEALMAYDGTLLIVSHDRDFLEGLTNRTLEFKDRKTHIHLGDVNEFLEKRKIEDMRLLGKKSNLDQDQKKGDQQSSNANYKERKKVQREISNAEKKIEKLEAKIQDFEQTMADPAFYQSDTLEQTTNEYNKTRKLLNEQMSIWEKALAEMDKLQ